MRHPPNADGFRTSMYPGRSVSESRGKIGACSITGAPASFPAARLVAGGLRRDHQRRKGLASARRSIWDTLALRRKSFDGHAADRAGGEIRAHLIAAFS